MMESIIHKIASVQPMEEKAGSLFKFVKPSSNNCLHDGEWRLYFSYGCFTGIDYWDIHCMKCKVQYIRLGEYVDFGGKTKEWR